MTLLDSNFFFFFNNNNNKLISHIHFLILKTEKNYLLK